MNTPDLLNLIGLTLGGSGSLLLVACAPIPQRMGYFMGIEQGNAKVRKDRLTRKLYPWGFAALALGFFIQLAAQLIR